MRWRSRGHISLTLICSFIWTSQVLRFTSQLPLTHKKRILIIYQSGVFEMFWSTSLFNKTIKPLSTDAIYRSKHDLKAHCYSFINFHCTTGFCVFIRQITNDLQKLMQAAALSALINFVLIILVLGVLFYYLVFGVWLLNICSGVSFLFFCVELDVGLMPSFIHSFKVIQQLLQINRKKY